MKKSFLISGIVSAILSVICLATNIIYNATTTYSGAAVEVMREQGDTAGLRHHNFMVGLMDTLMYVGIALLVLAVVLFLVGRRKKSEEM